jgi:hypothetical protein
MSAIKIAAVVLIVAGVLGLAYGSFSYTKETHHATLGPIDLSVKDRETINVPVWAGVGADGPRIDGNSLAGASRRHYRGCRKTSFCSLGQTTAPPARVQATPPRDRHSWRGLTRDIAQESNDCDGH